MSEQAIYLVANRRSEEECGNLVHSIRLAGCQLPIVLLPFGGEPVTDARLLREVALMDPAEFSPEAHDFVDEASKTLTVCPPGFLRRFYAFFGPYPQFLYSDNDIVALMDWSELFALLGENDLLHADEEYTTDGRFNYHQPTVILETFGEDSLQTAMTAGHFLARPTPQMIEDMRAAMQWMRAHPGVCKAHDQTMLHLASLLGNWRMLNLCKPPQSWLSSWAGDYENQLDLIQAGQRGLRISHLHYSGGSPRKLNRPVEELILSYLDTSQRRRALFTSHLLHFSGFNALAWVWKRGRAKLKRHPFFLNRA